MNCKYIFILVMLVLFLSISVYVYAGETIMITIGEWEPFIGESLPHYGIIPHIISKIYQKADITVIYGFFPWKRSYEYVQNGDWNASAIWGKTSERKQDCYFSNVVYTGEIVLFYLRDNPITWTGEIDDLNGLTIGLKLGSAKGKLFEEAERQGLITYDVGGDQITIFQKLLSARVDALDENKAMGLHILQMHFSKEDQSRIIYTDPYESWEYHMVFSKKLDENLRFLKIFNEGLLEMKDSGRYDEMWNAFYQGSYTLQ